MSTQKSLCILWSGNSARVPCQLMICSTATPPDLGVAPEPLPESLHLIPEFRDYPHSPGGLHLNFHRVSRDCREFGLMRMALKVPNQRPAAGTSASAGPQQTGTWAWQPRPGWLQRGAVWLGSAIDYASPTIVQAGYKLCLGCDWVCSVL